MPIQSELIKEERASSFTGAFFKPVQLTDEICFTVEDSWKKEDGQCGDVTVCFPVLLNPEIVLYGSDSLEPHVSTINKLLGIRNENNAVTALLSNCNTLKDLVLREQVSPLPINYAFVEFEYDFNKVCRKDNSENKVELIKNIVTYAKFLFSKSGLSRHGVVISDINLVVGCDPVLAQVLNSGLVTWDVFNIAPEFRNWNIQASPDARMRNKIIFTFDIPSKTDEGLPTFFNIGYHPYYKGDILLGEEAKAFKDGFRGLNLSPNAKEVMFGPDKIVFQNRSAFVITLPIMGAVNISNIEAAFSN